MIDDDDIPEDVKRGVEKALFGPRPSKPVVVTTKRKYRMAGPSKCSIDEKWDRERIVYVDKYEDDH